MEFSHNPKVPWPQYNTGYSSLGPDPFEPGPSLGKDHENPYAAPPAYGQRAAYNQFDIQDSPVHHGAAYGQWTSYHQFDIQDVPMHHGAAYSSSVPPSQPLKKQRGTMRSAFIQSLYHLFCTVFASGIFAVTAGFTQATFSATSTNFLLAFNSSFGPTIATLRLLQGLTSTCITIVLNQAFERLQWSVASSHYGIRVLSFLTLSPTTTLYGIFGIAFGWRARLLDRSLAFLRLFFLLAIWVSGIVLFVNTSIATVYEPIETFPVTAGVGQFNASLVEPYLKDYGMYLPLSTVAFSFSLVAMPDLSIEVDSVNCTTDQCESYLFPGGVETITPWEPSDHLESPVVQIHNAPAFQIQFQQGIAKGDKFLSSDCTVYGSEKSEVGVSFCLAQSQVHPGSYNAALYVCKDGTKKGQCLNSDGVVPNISTTFSVYSRKATTFCARTNNSILAVSDLTTPVQNTNIDIVVFKKVMSWLLDYTALQLPAISSIAFAFWNSQMVLSSNLWSTEEYTWLKSLITFVLWLFNVNNYGNSIMVESPDAEITYLPPEYYTTASICSPYLKVVVDLRMFSIYLILQLLVLAFVWITLFCFWLAGSLIPEISSYPLIDFAAKAVERNVPDGRVGLGEKLEGLTHGQDMRIRKELSDVTIFLRSDGGQQAKGTGAAQDGPNEYDGLRRRLLFLTDSGDGMERLKKGIRYH